MVCDPRAHFNEFASARTELQRLVILSDVSEEKFKELKANHKGSMTIPYINVPASGEFDYMKQQTDQVRRLLKVDLDTETTSTIYASTLSGDGLKAYQACLRSERVSVEADASSVFDRTVNLIVSWTPERGQVGELTDIRLTQGNIVGDIDRNMEPNGQSIVQVERDPDHTCDVTVVVNDFAGKIVLPKRPSHELVMEEVVLPPANEPRVSAWSNHHNGYREMVTRQTFHAPPGTEFLLGSQKQTDVVIDGAEFKPTFEVSGDARTVTITAKADSPVAHHGAGAHGRAMVTVLRPRPIQYPAS